MTELLNSLNLTAFDAAVVGLMVVSALMATARGFIRELASILAFLIALGVAFATYFYVSPHVVEALPDTLDEPTVIGATVGLAFLIVYIFAAWLGKKFSRFVHTSTDITLVDRLAGFVFGIARVYALFVALLFIAHPFIEAGELQFISDSFSYPYFIQAVIWVQSVMPAVADSVQQAIPETVPDRS